jgi:hypothetical protein
MITRRDGSGIVYLSEFLCSDQSEKYLVIKIWGEKTIKIEGKIKIIE